MAELYTEDPDNHDDVVTHLEPDILVCEVKWALGSISINRASGRDGIPVDQFQILNDDEMEEPRWWRNRTGRPLSPLQIHRNNI